MKNILQKISEENLKNSDQKIFSKKLLKKYFPKKCPKGSLERELKKLFVRLQEFSTEETDHRV
jgi:hypothetical protein